ncbi:MAG: hypothetical protein HQL77_07530 [Magnetococcales bacterium]|nr:hypothetical protein [Magnetococcales bacterium]
MAPKVTHFSSFWHPSRYKDAGHSPTDARGNRETVSLRERSVYDGGVYNRSALEAGFYTQLQAIGKGLHG